MSIMKNISNKIKKYKVSLKQNTKCVNFEQGCIQKCCLQILSESRFYSIHFLDYVYPWSKNIPQSTKRSLKTLTFPSKIRSVHREWDLYVDRSNDFTPASTNVQCESSVQTLLFPTADQLQHRRNVVECAHYSFELINKWNRSMSAPIIKFTHFVRWWYFQLWNIFFESGLSFNTFRLR